MAQSVVIHRSDTAPGRAGTSIRGGVQTNLFRLHPPKATFEHFDVSIQLPGGRTNKENESDQAPAKPVPKRFYKPVIDYLQTRSQFSDRFNPKGAYDGVAAFYISSTAALIDEMRASGQRGAQYKFKMTDSSIVPGAAPSEKDYIVRLQWVAQIQPKLVDDVIRGRANAEGSLQVVNAVNALLRMVPLERRSNDIATKRAFFSAIPEVSLGDGLALHIGIFSSVRPIMGSLALNLDTTSVVMYRSADLIDFCLGVLNANDPRQLAPSNVQNLTSTVLPVLKRVKVAYGERYPMYRQSLTAGMAKRNTVVGFTQRGADGHQFLWEREDGQSEVVTVETYYRVKHGVRLTFPKLSCAMLKSARGPGTEAIVPLEFLMVPPGQVFKSTLKGRASDTMIQTTKRDPGARLQLIRNALVDLGFAQSDVAGRTGMRLENDLQRPSARQLLHPIVTFAKGVKAEIREGGWDMRRKEYHQPAKILGMGIVVFDEKLRRDARSVDALKSKISTGFSDPLWGTLRNRGIRQWAPPVIITAANGQAIEQVLVGAAEQVIRVSWDAAISQGYKEPTAPLSRSDVLLICILKNPDHSQRQQIKTWSEVSEGVATQIINTEKLRRDQQVDGQYLNNVALKINLKMGGVNSTVSNPWFDTNERTMLIGADVSHPSPGSDSPSIASLVYNAPRSCSQYGATSRVQTARREMIEDFAGMVKEAIDSWGIQRLPHRIVIFRDGLSEGEFDRVVNSEVAALIELLNLRPPGLHMPKITFVVVGKRHHIRFFPASNTDRQHQTKGNMASGLVVDTDVVHPLYRDFYLQSQKALMGTSRPSHYTVLLDQNKMSQDDLQGLCFALCHAYNRSTTAVSIPAPVYYADLVCTRARLHLSHFAFGSEGSLIEDEGSGNLDNDPAMKERLNAMCRIHPRQKRRMYFA